jgi:hypothetical protein
MPDDNRHDPFKPPQPRIPGVPDAVARTIADRAELPTLPGLPQPAPRRMPVGWNRLLMTAGLVIAAGLLWRIHKSSPTEPAQPRASRVLSPSETAEKSKPAEVAPVAPGWVATTDELARPWSAKRFLIRASPTTEPIHAIVVHLPGGAYWGFSLREPYGDCELEYVTDLKKLQTDYHFHAVHPMVGDPCTGALFDLMRYGSGPGGLVRGEVEQGAAIRPPLAIEIERRGKQIVAVRTE